MAEPSEARYQVEYRTLDWEMVPTVAVARVYYVSRWEGITESESYRNARVFAANLWDYHKSVNVVRVGPRGGRTNV